MPRLISLLWIGPGRGLAENGVPDAPTLDVVWLRETDEAFSMSREPFDVIVLAHEERALQEEAIQRFARLPDAPPLIVLAQSRDVDAMREALTVDAGRVVEIVHEDEATDSAPSAPNAGESRVSDVQGAGAERHASARMSREIVHHVRRVVDERSAELRRRRSEADDVFASKHPDIIAVSASFRGVLDMIDRAASGRASVLLEGETGTGKEVLARAVHRASPRAKGPFVAINCAALTDSLLESELFGHIRGAFTGATSTKPGLFEAAAGGTLFLDEIGETSPSMQAKLLRTLQDKEIRPVGGNAHRKIDVRIVSATNRDLRVQARKGNFREDLYYRLAVFPITLPPLRKRGDDILPLARHFLAFHNDHPKLPPCTLSQAAAELMLRHAWPGNVRELENEVQRMITLAGPGQTLAPHHLSPMIVTNAQPIEDAIRTGETLREVVARAETTLIRNTLAKNGGRRAMSARQLGITREGLYKKMKRLKID
jgi:transcriptional regulator with PAS, ATPase and Fis domain